MLGHSYRVRNTGGVAVDLNPRADWARRHLEVPLIAAALLVLPVIVVETTVSDPLWSTLP